MTRRDRRGRSHVDKKSDKQRADALAKIRAALAVRVDEVLDGYSLKKLAEQDASDVVDDILFVLTQDDSENQTRGAVARGGAELARQIDIAEARARAVSLWAAQAVAAYEPVISFRREVLDGVLLRTDDVSGWLEGLIADDHAWLEEIVDEVRLLAAPWTEEQTQVFIAAGAVPFVPPLRGEFYRNLLISPARPRIVLDIDPSLPPDVVAGLFSKIRPALAPARKFPSTDADPRLAEFLWQRLDPAHPEGGPTASLWRAWNATFPEQSYESPEAFGTAANGVMTWLVRPVDDEPVLAEGVVDLRLPRPDFFRAPDGSAETLETLRSRPLSPIRHQRKKRRL